MADFVAVIRRAVDGLSDNNAEMRQRVYEKARGAVRRQLESMNPRPSDELMKRQLEKLEAAIVSVEDDNAEALPAEEPVLDPVEDAAPDAAEPVAEEAVVAQPEEETAPQAVDEPVAEQHVEAAPVVEEPVADEPEAEAAEAAPVAQYEAAYEEPAAHEEPVADEEPVAVEAHAEPSWQAEAEPEPASEYIPSWREPEREMTEEAGAETFEASEPEPQAPVPDEDLPQAEPAVEAEEPVAATQWNWSGAAASADVVESQPSAAAAESVSSDSADAEPVAWEWPEEKVVRPEDDKPQPAQKNEWDDLDALIGVAPKAEPAAGASTARTETVAAEPARAPQRSFRAEPRRSRFNFGALIGILAFLGIAGGAGAAYWFNRDAVNGWVDMQVATLTEMLMDKPAQTPKTEEAAGDAQDVPAKTTPSDAAPATENGAAATTEVASAAQGNGKFTQRLLTDGSEVDNGPAPALDGGGAEEGKSVAAQTAQSAEPATGDGGQTPAAGTGGVAETPAGAATTGEAQTPAAAGDQAAVGVGQKMFLYEERLGQTGPTAIEGTAAWSTAEESPGGEAKAEPVVRAQISVPAKGLTALVTFRRNADRSLPASHIIELVFSLPENFEGGGIESVQRVAMKRAEQDRGDALIAVPAKITDDFHMIALNDFPEAIAKNMELLRTRSWIDIPITYRNGRRALLTLDKGAAGTEAFDKVLKSWASLGK